MDLIAALWAKAGKAAKPCRNAQQARLQGPRPSGVFRVRFFQKRPLRFFLARGPPFRPTTGAFWQINGSNEQDALRPFALPQRLLACSPALFATKCASKVVRNVHRRFRPKRTMAGFAQGLVPRSSQAGPHSRIRPALAFPVFARKGQKGKKNYFHPAPGFSPSLQNDFGTRGVFFSLCLKKCQALGLHSRPNIKTRSPIPLVAGRDPLFWPGLQRATACPRKVNPQFCRQALVFCPRYHSPINNGDSGSLIWVFERVFE